MQEKSASVESENIEVPNMKTFDALADSHMEDEYDDFTPVCSQGRELLTESLYMKWEEQMQSMESIYGGVGNYDMESYNFIQQVLSSVEVFNNVSTISMAEAKSVAANKSHSEAERRRRKRINAHLSTLRTLLPNTVKSDKASLLAEVVRCIGELKKTTADLAANPGGDFVNLFPSEADELNLCYTDGDSGSIIKATICCEDRPEIMLELTKALNSVQAKVVKAEMATIGGRTKAVLWLDLIRGGGEEVLTLIRRALKVVIDKSILLAGPAQGLPGNKRPRLYHC